MLLLFSFPGSCCPLLFPRMSMPNRSVHLLPNPGSCLAPALLCSQAVLLHAAAMNASPLGLEGGRRGACAEDGREHERACLGDHMAVERMPGDLHGEDFRRIER